MVTLLSHSGGPPAPAPRASGAGGPPAACWPSAAAHPWAIQPSALPVALPQPGPGPAAAQDDGAAAQPAAADGEPEGPADRGVAVLRADGIVLPRCGAWLERYGWAVSCEALPGRIEAAAASASAVVVRFNSPGGSAAGVSEAAARIAAVARRATVVAVADHLAASAAYWLAASCTALVVSPSALVGSVGVFLVRPSVVRALDADGVDVDVLSRGDGKTDRLILTALTDEGRGRLDAEVAAYYADFVAAVARARGVPAKTVRDGWGASVLTAAAAVEAGMADRVMTADEAAARAGTAAGRRLFRSMGSARAIVAGALA